MMRKHLFITVFFVFTVILFLNCGGNKNKSLEENSAHKDDVVDLTKDEVMAIDAAVDSTQKAEEKKRQTTIVTELDGAKLKKTTSYPYISIKFYQQDTDVEMVLDPISTNIDLDLKRRPDGMLEVRKGDEVLTQMGTSDSLHMGSSKNSPYDTTEDLTDDIIQDINLAQQLFYQDEYDEALKILNASLAKKKTASAYALGGSIYFVSGDMKEAVHAWENALKINPGLEELKGLVARYKNATAE
ncbi:tetratricopeptide repeat protein [candidate division KSB1 bacterium]|nr:tetratricopeptide repeat protein [candidate division KSB1 bacterium]